jgi:hypothetical protein
MDEAREEARRFLDINPGFWHAIGRPLSRSKATRIDGTSSIDISEPVCRDEAGFRQ